MSDRDAEIALPSASTGTVPNTSTGVQFRPSLKATVSSATSVALVVGQATGWAIRTYALAADQALHIHRRHR